MAQWRSIDVEVPQHPYTVHVAAGLLDEAGLRLAGFARGGKLAVVTDSLVERLYLDRLLRSIEAASLSAVTAVIPAGEEHKTLDVALGVFDRLLRAGIERSTLLVALGGGVVGDLAGFVAATILRGIRFVQMPTTLLAMVDASVGGKTAVNHAVGKNLIGAFHQPAAVLIDPQTLATLPGALVRGGLAECIKHDIIRDAAGFARLEANVGRAIALDIDYLAELVAHNVAIKAQVVASDPFEQGERAHLNFGHTFGHAIETVSNYAVPHGEAVALGMCAASALAARLGMITRHDLERIRSLIAAAGLPTGIAGLDADSVLRAMSFDKKVSNGRLRLVLPVRIGEVTIRDDVPAEQVREAVETIRDEG